MLIGKRIRLRACERSDIPQFVVWLNDPEVIAGLALINPMSSASEEKWFDQMMQTPEAEHPLVIEVKEGNQWRMIGNLSLMGIDARCQSAEIGIFIGDKADWNQGYGAEAIRLLLEHGFLTLNLNRIFLRVYETNPRAMRCYEKIGFQKEGTLRQAWFQNGKFINVHLMSVLRDEYLAR